MMMDIKNKLGDFNGVMAGYHVGNAKLVDELFNCTYQLPDKAIVTIGRANGRENGNDISIPTGEHRKKAIELPDNDPTKDKVLSVSRKHAAIRYWENRFTITDLNSTSGTYVNDVQIVASVPAELKNGDKIKLGLYPLTFAVEK